MLYDESRALHGFISLRKLIIKDTTVILGVAMICIPNSLIHNVIKLSCMSQMPASLNNDAWVTLEIFIHSYISCHTIGVDILETFLSCSLWQACSHSSQDVICTIGWNKDIQNVEAFHTLSFKYIKNCQSWMIRWDWVSVHTGCMVPNAINIILDHCDFI